MATKLKHTPGPWHTVPYGDGDDTVICSDAAGNLRIAFMAVPGCRDKQERRKKFGEIKANARLIAASPEMLEALIGLEGILATAESNASGNPEWEAVSAKIDAARAAIAKALDQ